MTHRGLLVAVSGLVSTLSDGPSTEYSPVDYQRGPRMDNLHL